MLWTAIISAFAPAAVEGIKQVITKFTGGVRPTTVDEQIRLDQSDIERLRVVALLDTPIGNPSQWVVDLRASARYVGALVIILSGIASIFVPDEILAPTVKYVALEAASSGFGFLFGQRIMVNMKGK